MTGLSSFKRLTGAPADVKELEYIAALHQTCIPTTRDNGTVSSLDVQRFLVSRHGVKISHERAIRIVRSLGGGLSQPLLSVKKKGHKHHLSDRLLLKRVLHHGGNRHRGGDSSNKKEEDEEVPSNRSATKEAGADVETGALEEKNRKSSELTGGIKKKSFPRSLLLRHNNKNNNKSKKTSSLHHGTPPPPAGSEKEASLMHRDDYGDVPPTSDDEREERKGRTEQVMVDCQDDRMGIGTGQRSAVPTKDEYIPEQDLKDRYVPEEYLDVIQMTAVLFIPVLCKAAAALLKQSQQQLEEATANVPDEEVSLQEPTSLWREQHHNKKQNQKEKKTSLQPQPPTLLQDVLDMMLNDTLSSHSESASTTNEGAPLLDFELVKAILLGTGEYERAQNPALIREMVAVAQSPSGRLDVEAFAAALTSDLQAWDMDSEDRHSTLFFDVFGEEHQASTPIQPAKKMYDKDETEDRVVGNVSNDSKIKKEEKDVSGVKSVLRGMGIDYVVDAHTSVVAVMLIWFFYVMNAVTYGSLFHSLVHTGCEADGDESFGCILMTTLWTWFVLALFFSLFGMVVVWPFSWGNDPSTRSTMRMFLVICLAFFYTTIPYAITINFINDSDKPYNPAEERANHTFFEPLLHVTFVGGLLVLLLFGFQFFNTLVGKMISSKTEIFDYWLSTSYLIGEVRGKKAATRKLNKMILNATALHSPIDEKTRPLDKSLSTLMPDEPKHSKTDQTTLNYVLFGQQYEDIGGLVWTWKNILSGHLFDTEGIWIPTRMVVFQGAQVIICAVFTTILIWFSEMAVDAADEATADLDPDLPKWVKDLVPTGQEVRRALWPALWVAFLVMIILILIYLPSACASILLFRCGEIPSLGSRNFVKYRDAVDTTYMNMGNAIYALLGSASLFFLVIGLIIFLFIWPFSKTFMIRLLAWILGLGITISLKMILTKTCRRTQYRSFYRTRPNASSISSLALECWFVGLGASVLISRICQFLFAAIFWIGRIDVKYLSEDVQLLGYSFDYVPMYFTKDLLVHEAHRHPFLARLAQMYLMKIRHEDFGSNVGSAVWRQLFVQALMPWLRKYRVFSKTRVQQAIEGLKKQKLEAEAEEQGYIGDFEEDMEGVAMAGLGFVGEAVNVAERMGGAVQEVDAADSARRKSSTGGGNGGGGGGGGVSVTGSAVGSWDPAGKRSTSMHLWTC